MRWRFHDPANSQEAAEVAAVTARIDSWWSDFSHRHQELEGISLPSPLLLWVNTRIRSIHPLLSWEIGPAMDFEGRRLVITPDYRHLHPMVTSVLERAPAIPGWRYQAYRPVEPMDSVALLVKTRTGGTIDRMQVQVTKGKHQHVDLHFQVPPGGPPLDRAILAAELLLGGDVLDKWVGQVTTEPREPPGILSRLLGRRPSRDHWLPLERLKPSVDALIGSILDQLPDRPYALMDTYPSLDGKTSGHRQVGCVFELKPPQRPDYPCWADLYVGSSCVPDVWLASHTDPRFASAGFSRFGETFCYLKTDGSAGPCKFEDRCSMDDALDKALGDEKVGRTMGGGMGYVYTYIDFALCDVPRAIEVIRQVLRNADIARRSWLLFFDEELAEEWVGIWDDTPAPPTA